MLIDFSFASFFLFRKKNSIPILKWYHHRCNGINVYNVIKFVVRLVVAHCSILVFGFCKAIAIAKWHHNNNNWNNPLFYYGDLCDANKTDKTNFIAKIVYWNLYTLMELETSRSEGERAKWHEKNRTKLFTQSVGWLLLLLLFFCCKQGKKLFSFVARAFDRYYISILQHFRSYSCYNCVILFHTAPALCLPMVGLYLCVHSLE